MRARAIFLILWALGACDGKGNDDDALDSTESALLTDGVNGELRLQNDWGSGYCAEVTLQNTNAASVSSWSAVVELNESTLSQLWNATAVQNGSRITVQPLSWNSSLAPGATIVAFGFCANGTGANYRPALASLSIVGGSSSSDAGSGSGGSSGSDAGSSSGGGSSGSDAGSSSVGGSSGSDAGSSTGGGSSGGSSGLPASCSGTCNAATPVYPTLQSDGGLGNVTMYSTSASAGGACNYGTSSVMYYAAINVHVQPGDGMGQWQGGHVCGQCAEVTVLTSQGPRSVVVRIMDKCADAHCGIDLGGASSSAVMLDGSGRYQGQWKFVSCSGHPEVSDGAPSLTVVSGSNPWWSRLRVRNPIMAVDTIAWSSSTANGVFPFATDPENAFEVPISVLQSQSASFQVTVHYADGSSASVQLTPSQLAAGGASYALN